MHFSSYTQLAAKPSRKLIANFKASEITALLLLEPIRMERCPVQQPNREVLRRIGKVTLTPRLNRACSITGAYARLIFLIIDQLFHTHTLRDLRLKPIQNNWPVNQLEPLRSCWPSTFQTGDFCRLPLTDLGAAQWVTCVFSNQWATYLLDSA